jgi:trans-2,3-dihydro-3-hydroxyanthranilate isomerase
MDKRKFYIVDVFAQEKYSGNQLAVFREAGSLSSDEMQSIAREMHFSETTFILSDEPREGGYDVRIFTPEREVPFAGHPTLGTAFVIQREILGGQGEEITLNLKVGPIPVNFENPGNPDEVLWMRQNRPHFGLLLEPEQTAAAIGLRANELDDRFPIQEVSTGLPFVIAPLRHFTALRHARADLDAYNALIEPLQSKAVLLFCSGGYEEGQELSVRVFAPYYGVLEDPATGSGTGCLAAYLVQQDYFGSSSIDIQVGQGYEINRPSTLHLRASREEEGIHVEVGGRVTPVAEGNLVTS